MDILLKYLQADIWEEITKIEPMLKKFYYKTFKQLKNWGLQFDELLMGKPSYDYFIDDKSYNIRSENAKRIINKFSK